MANPASIILERIVIRIIHVCKEISQANMGALRIPPLLIEIEVWMVFKRDRLSATRPPSPGRPFRYAAIAVSVPRRGG